MKSCDKTDVIHSWTRLNKTHNDPFIVYVSLLRFLLRSNIFENHQVRPVANTRRLLGQNHVRRVLTTEEEDEFVNFTFDDDDKSKENDVEFNIGNIW